jgi:osmotically-inducible protein OsmY
MPSMVGSED